MFEKEPFIKITRPEINFGLTGRSPLKPTKEGETISESLQWTFLDQPVLLEQGETASKQKDFYVPKKYDRSTSKHECWHLFKGANRQGVF